MSKTLKLNNGYEIPTIGLGTYNATSTRMCEAVKAAIDVGYRHFDCAWLYGNEEGIGMGLHQKIRQKVVKREDLFVTNKLWNNFHARERVVQKIKDSLKKCSLDYFDLYLIHWPFGFKENVPSWPIDEGPKAYSDVDYLETWKGMEECVQLNLAKSIGVSNFNSQQLQRLLDNCKIKPVVNQIEVNPNINQKKLIQFCKDRDIVVTGYCPLGSFHRPGAPKSSLSDPKIAAIGRKYNKTAAQVILNYLISLGICVIPKSERKERIIENIDIYDFQLDSDDIAYLDSCNKNKRICGFKCFSDHKYYGFNIEF